MQVCIQFVEYFANLFMKYLNISMKLQGYHPYIGMTEVGTVFLKGLGEHLGNMLCTDEVGEAGAKIIETASTASIWHIHQKGESAYEIPNERTSLADILKHQNWINMKFQTEITNNLGSIVDGKIDTSRVLEVATTY